MRRDFCNTERSSEKACGRQVVPVENPTMSINIVRYADGAGGQRRRRSPSLVLLSVLAVLGLLATACGTDSGAAESDAAPQATAPQVTLPETIPAGTTLRVGDQFDALKNLLALSGQDQGFEYELEYSSFAGGPPMLQAFEADAVDVGFVADAPLVFAQAAGQDVVGIGAWAPGASTMGLITAPGVTDINGWADLKGKTVMIAEGTVLQSALLTGLASVGLSYDDVETVNVPAAQTATALPGSGADAAILIEPLTSAYLKDNPTSKEVVRSNDITDRVSFLIADGKVLKDDAKTAAAADYLSRIVKAYAWVNANTEAWAQKTYVEQYGLPLAKGVEILKAGGGIQILELPGELAGPQQALTDRFFEAGIIPRELDAASQFDSRFNTVVQEAQAK
jgi:sulfonate transport system substrate-binding protein